MLRRRLPLLVLLAGLIAPASALAVPTAGPSFDVPGKPQMLSGTADGGAWVALDGSGAAQEDLARVAPDGTVTAYPDAVIMGAKGILAVPGGEVWVTSSGRVSHFPPANPAAIDHLAIGGLNPESLAVGPDGKVWTASGDTAYRIDPVTFTIDPFTVAGMGARGITATADALLIADNVRGGYVRLTTAGAGTLVPGPIGGQQLAATPAGVVGMSAPTADPQQLALFTATPPAAVPQQGDPFGVVVGDDGAFWVANFNGPGLRRVATDGTFTDLPLGNGVGQRYLTKAGPGRFWVGNELLSTVQRVDGVTAPVVTPQPTPTPGGTPTPAPTPGPAVKPTVAATAKGLRKPGRPVVRITASAAGRATVLLERRAAGRRAGSRCVTPSRARKGKRCVRWVRVQRVSVALAARTAKRVRFRRVGAGRYRVRVTLAADGGTARTTVRLRVRR